MPNEDIELEIAIAEEEARARQRGSQMQSSAAPQAQPAQPGSFLEELTSAKNLYGKGTDNWGAIGEFGQGIKALGGAALEYGKSALEEGTPYPSKALMPIAEGMYDELASGQWAPDVAGIIPGATTGLQYLGDKYYGVNRPEGEYGKMLQSDLGVGGAATLLGGAVGKGAGMAARGVSTVADAVNPATRAARTASGVVDELRAVTGDANFMSKPVSADALSTQISEGMSRNAELARSQAGAQFDSALQGGYVDINPVAQRLKSEMAAKQGILDPQNPASSIVSGFKEMTTPTSGPIRVDPAGTAVVPGSGILPTESFQNVLRDVGQGAKRAEGTWGGTVLNDTKAALMKEAERQLPADKLDALAGARQSWGEYKQSYGEGAADAAQQITQNPDVGLNKLYNKLIQDSKSAEQMVAAMTPDELGQSKALVMQKMLELSPNQWGSFINKRRGALSQIFPESELAELTNWANGQSPATGLVKTDPTKLDPNQAMRQRAEGIAIGASALTGSPALGGVTIAGVSALEGGISLKNALKGKTILQARELLKRVAAGDPDAFAALNSVGAPGGGGISSNLTALIGATGGDLTAMLGGPQEAPPEVFPRNWADIKMNPSSRMGLSMLLQSVGILPPNAGIETLSEQDAKNAIAQATQIIPQAFQPPTGGYASEANGKLYSPMDQDAHKRAAMEASPSERAKAMAGLYDGNKYIPIGQTGPLEGTPQRKREVDISDINSLLGDSPMQYPRASQTTPSPEMGSMLQRLEEMTKIHAQDELQ